MCGHRVSVIRSSEDEGGAPIAPPLVWFRPIEWAERHAGPTWQIPSAWVGAVEVPVPDHRTEPLTVADRGHREPSDRALTTLVIAGPIGLTCRVYQTPEGLAGVPTPEQLRAALRAA